LNDRFSQQRLADWDRKPNLPVLLVDGVKAIDRTDGSTARSPRGTARPDTCKVADEDHDRSNACSRSPSVAKGEVPQRGRADGRPRLGIGV